MGETREGMFRTKMPSGRCLAVPLTATLETAGVGEIGGTRTSTAAALTISVSPPGSEAS